MAKNYSKYRSLLTNLVITDLKIKYKNSFLGIFWTLLEPLIIAVILLFVFSKIFTNNLANFSAYLLTGYTAWFFFTNTTGMLHIMVRKSNIVRKIKIPKEMLVFSSAIVGLIDSIFSFTVLILILMFLKVGFTFNILFLPLIIVLQFIFLLGLLLLLSSTYVFVRDMDKVWFIITQAWFFMTPIVYPQSLIAKSNSILLVINPMLHFISAYRHILVYGNPVSLSGIFILTFLALTSFILGWKVFSHYESKFAEVV